MDFRKLTSPKTQAHLAAQRQSILKFQALDPKPMAAALLQASRQLIDSGCFSSEPDFSHDEWALYRVIPAMARMLDPEVELRDTEIVKEGERRDPLTWAGDADTKKLKRAVVSLHLESAVKSILQNASLSRATLGDQADEDAAELLVGDRRRACALSVAMDCISPGLYFSRVESDTRPPLTGAYLIATRPPGHDRVLRYRENVEDLEAFMATAIAIREGADLTDTQEQLKTELRQATRDIEACTAISIQDFDGKILSEKTFKAAPEPHPEF